jgi:DNA processing protein
MTSDEERRALARLSRVAEPGDPAVWRAVQAQGPVQVWEALRAGAPVAQLSQGVLAGIAVRAQDRDTDDDLAAADACGARLVCPGDAEWPAHRLTWPPGGLLDPPPLALWVRGPWPLDEAVERSVAVVGARAASSYGLHVAGELAVGLAQARAAVVSGGAYGIDAAAHRGALVSGSAPTVAVLACGVDVAYPRGNDRLLGRSPSRGCSSRSCRPAATRRAGGSSSATA